MSLHWHFWETVVVLSGQSTRNYPTLGSFPQSPAEPVAFKSKAGDYLGLSLISLCDIKIAGNWPMCTCVRVYVRVYVCMYVCMYVCTGVHTCVQVYVRVYGCVYGCMYVCTGVCKLCQVLIYILFHMLFAYHSHKNPHA